MTIDEIIKILENSLAKLNTELGDAVSRGELEAIDGLNKQIADTQEAINKLKI